MNRGFGVGTLDVSFEEGLEEAIEDEAPNKDRNINLSGR